jgi:PAS domain S-box-containing protein
MNSNHLRIIIVEDDPAHAEAIKRAFMASGTLADIRIAGSLREYREAGANRVPDIVLMDLNLPDGKAVEVLSSPPESAPFPIVVMTSYGNEQVAVEAMKAGALDYVVKSPPVFTGMPGIVGRCLREWKLLRQRRQAEEGRIRLVTAVEQARDIIMITDPDGAIQYVNRALEEFTGEPRTGLIGRNLLDRKTGSDVIRVAWETVAQGEIWSGTITEKNRAGTDCDLDLTLTPVRDERGFIYSVVAMGRDVTREKQLEARFNQAQKMEAIGKLAGGIAHDFNNILSAVIGYTELSLGMAPKGEGLEKNLQEVLTAGFRARDLVKQILAFSRQSPQDKKPVQVSLIVKEVLKLLRASLPATIEIRQELRSNGIVLADPTHIHQIMMNLCTNASHAMKETGGILSIALIDERLDGEFAETHGGIDPGRYVKLSVSDTGCGIRKELLDRIFEPFFTTKDKGEGTGLGLSVVHGIVKECAGTITVKSEPGAGTAFTVYLPLIKKAAEAAVGQKEEYPPGTEHILIVDDEESIVRMWQQILEKLGYTVEVSRSALEALELFRRRTQQFDLVITDMTMPKMTGDKLAGEIHRIRPDIPIILISGYASTLSREEALALGIKAALMKPADTLALTKAIRHVLDNEKK